MKIILPTQIADDVVPKLPADITVVRVDTQGKFDGDPSDAQAYYRWWGPTPPFEPVLAAAPQVRWLHTPSAGVDHLLVPAVMQSNVVLTNGAGVHAIPIAEFVMGFMLDYAKGMTPLRNAQTEHRWASQRIRELLGATLMVVGMGGIGQAIATRAAAFGMRIWGVRRTPCAMEGVERVVGLDEWQPLLPQVDYLVIATPLTPQTRGMINAEVLRAMRPTAYLINVARGAVIDDDALMTALREKWIGGAALDTFETEPLPADNPYWDIPNIFITPHTTSGSPRMRERSIALFLDNLTRFMAGEPLRNVVDKEAGY